MTYTGPPMVFGIDPGEITGVARYDLSLDRYDNWQYPVAGMHMLEDLFKFTQRRVPECAVVCEQYIITHKSARSTQQPWSLEITGLVRYLARKYNMTFTLVQRSASKTLMTNDKLKALDWHRPGRGHANDAARSLGQYLLTQGWYDDRLKEML